MLNSFYPPFGADILAGANAQFLLIAAAAVMMMIALVGYAVRLMKRSGMSATLGGGLLVLLGVLLASGAAWFGDDSALRRSIDARTAELTARAIAPGSPLACLDALANNDVEAACEKSLFATPESVATAVAYVDAKISLLAAGASLAARDQGYQPSFERARRALEADRYGLVAHVLRTRGCDSHDCAELKLLRNTGTVLINMKSQTFDGYVAVHAGAWHLKNAGAVANASPPSAATPPPAVAPTPPVATSGAGPGGPVPKQFDFPSSASIPAVSIMNAEPSLPAAAEQQPETRAAPASAAQASAATPPKRQQAQQPRRQNSREAASQAPMAALPPPPPQSPPPTETPQTVAPQPVMPQTSGQH